MKSFLTAMQEGRLIELPESHKDKAFEYLGALIEAIPDVPPHTDIYGMALKHEKEQNTAIGHGVACPHVRIAGHGELHCAVGWSPKGIHYESSDGKVVHLVIMYCIPEGERIAYLKEISMIVRALQGSNLDERLSKMTDLNSVRDLLLDLVDSSLDLAIPEARARMIQLEVKQAVVSAAQTQAPSPFEIVPLTVLYFDQGHIVLSQNRDLVKLLESNSKLIEPLKDMKESEGNGYRIIPRTTSSFEMGRVLCDCIAVKIT